MPQWRVGASLWGLTNQAGEFGWPVTKPGLIGCQYNYQNLQWMPGSPVFHKARASGLRVTDWQNVILVNMLGRRFYDETGAHFTSNNYGSVEPYEPLSYRNAKNLAYDPNNWLNAALAGVGETRNGGGPIWAIFDAAAVAREAWDPHPPNVDTAAGFFFSANTIEELAAAIAMPYQRMPMPPQHLQETVARYNDFVDTGVDADFAKPAPRYKVETPAVLRRLGDAGDPRFARRVYASTRTARSSTFAAASSPDSTAAASRPAASASTAWRAHCAKASSPAATQRRPANARASTLDRIPRISTRLCGGKRARRCDAARGLAGSQRCFIGAAIRHGRGLFPA